MNLPALSVIPISVSQIYCGRTNFSPYLLFLAPLGSCSPLRLASTLVATGIALAQRPGSFHSNRFVDAQTEVCVGERARAYGGREYFPAGRKGGEGRMINRCLIAPEGEGISLSRRDRAVKRLKRLVQGLSRSGGSDTCRLSLVPSHPSKGSKEPWARLAASLLQELMRLLGCKNDD